MSEPRDILSFCDPDGDGESTPPGLSLHCPPAAGEAAVPDEPAAIRIAQILDAHRPALRTQPFAWQDLQAEQSPRPVTIRLGRAPLHESLTDAARHGSIIPLDGGTDDTVDVVVDGVIVGQGRVVVVQGKLAVELVRVAERRLQRSA